MDDIPEDTSRFMTYVFKRAKTYALLTLGMCLGAPSPVQVKGSGGSASVFAQKRSLLLLELTGADFLFASNSCELNWPIKEPEYLCTP